MRTFALTLLFAFIGTLVGQFVPPALFIPLIIFELTILIFAFFFRKKGSVGYTFVYFFTFLTGVTSYPVLTHYVNELGGQIVSMIFLTTMIIFGVLGTIGYKTKRNLIGWGSILFSALLALIIVSILSLFLPFGSAGVWVITIAGNLIFSFYTIYDFNVIKHQPLTDEDVPLMALNLYLDFLNLFLDLLRLVGLLSNDD